MLLLEFISIELMLFMKKIACSFFVFEDSCSWSTIQPICSTFDGEEYEKKRGKYVFHIILLLILILFII